MSSAPRELRERSLAEVRRGTAAEPHHGRVRRMLAWARRKVYRYVPTLVPSENFSRSLNFFLYHTRFGGPSEVVPPPAAERIVVLAPHADDETIGCGGVLSRYADAGAQTAVIVVTDGRRGDPDIYRSGLDEKQQREAEDRLVSRRKAEAARAAEILGVKTLVFLDQPDACVRPTAEAVARLRAELERLSPQVLLLPFLIDKHPDHLETNGLFLHAAASLWPGDGGPICWAYETWTPLHANRTVDIRDVADRKWQALGQYESQIRHIDFVSTTKGLNAYRWGATFGNSGYAEAFFGCTLAEYRLLWKAMTGETL